MEEGNQSSSAAQTSSGRRGGRHGDQDDIEVSLAEFRRPRDSLLGIVTNFLTHSTVRVRLLRQMLVEARPTPELLDYKAHIVSHFLYPATAFLSAFELSVSVYLKSANKFFLLGAISCVPKSHYAKFIFIEAVFTIIFIACYRNWLMWQIPC